MSNILNRYSISSDLEIYCFHDDETKIVFVLVNHELADELIITEKTAKFLCITSESTINLNNWEDFRNGTRQFQKDNG